MRLIPTSGTPPPYVISSSVAHNYSNLNTPIFVLSSASSGALAFTYVYQLVLNSDLSSGVWHKITSSSSSIPGNPRYNSAVLLVKNLIYAYGGYDAVTGSASNAMWIYDITANQWSDSHAK